MADKSQQPTQPSPSDQNVQDSKKPEEGLENTALHERLARSARDLTSSMMGTPDTQSLRSLAQDSASKGSATYGRSTESAGESSGTAGHDFGRNALRAAASDGRHIVQAHFDAFLNHAASSGPSGSAVPYNSNLGRAAHPPQTVKEQEARDGEGVVAFLSDSTSACFEDDVVFGVSPNELPRLRAALFTEARTTPTPWDSLLNFWPDATDSSAVSGFANPSTSRDLWLAEWKGVLTRYNDEVWGELAPDARQARGEVDALQAGEAQNPVALRRLGQILVHIRGGTAE